MASNLMTAELKKVANKIKEYMKEKQYSSATVEYSGSGDSGDVECLSATRGEESVDNDETFKDLIWELLEQLHRGFEINEGGNGTIDLSLRGDVLSVEHSGVNIVYDEFGTEFEV